MSAKELLDNGKEIRITLKKGKQGYKLTIVDDVYYFDKYNDLKQILDDELKDNNGPA